MMKLTYTAPAFDVKTFGDFENVFTYCTKGNAHEQGCCDVTGSGNASDAPDPQSCYAAFSGGGSSGSGI